jgi:16S rRNA (cytosine967-C5)-methyltransferase
LSVAANQLRTFLRIAAELRPHWHRDAALPARLRAILAAHKEFGSRDRRLYRELAFTALRYLPWIEPLLETSTDEAARRLAWLCADLPATHAFREAFASGSKPAGDPAECLPGWFRGHCPEIFAGAELAAQFRRAPLWLRLQAADPAPVFEEWKALGWKWRASALLPGAVELAGDVDVTRTHGWQEGHVEVQDLGSQLVLESVAPSPCNSLASSAATAVSTRTTSGPRPSPSSARASRALGSATSAPSADPIPTATTGCSSTRPAAAAAPGGGPRT